jgi:hypothetical protein
MRNAHRESGATVRNNTAATRADRNEELDTRGGCMADDRKRGSNESEKIGRPMDEDASNAADEFEEDDEFDEDEEDDESEEDV